MAHGLKFLEILAGICIASGVYTLFQAIAKSKVLPAISVNDPARFKKINHHFMNDKRSLYKASAIMMSIGLALFVFTFIIS
jgi:hypothetical protein